MSTNGCQLSYVSSKSAFEQFISNACGTGLGLLAGTAVTVASVIGALDAKFESPYNAITSVVGGCILGITSGVWLGKVTSNILKNRMIHLACTQHNVKASATRSEISPSAQFCSIATHPLLTRSDKINAEIISDIAGILAASTFSTGPIVIGTAVSVLLSLGQGENRMSENQFVAILGTIATIGVASTILTGVITRTVSKRYLENTWVETALKTRQTIQLQG